MIARPGHRNRLRGYVRIVGDDDVSGPVPACEGVKITPKVHVPFAGT